MEKSCVRRRLALCSCIAALEIVFCLPVWPADGDAVGFELRLQEIKEISGGPLAAYHGYTTGLATGKEYLIFTTRLDGTLGGPIPATIGEHGELRIGDGLLTLAYGGMSWGEPTKLTLVEFVDDEPTILATYTLVPFPRKASDDHGRSIELRHVDADGQIFELLFRGWAPGESVRFISSSGRETIDSKKELTEDYSVHLLPAVTGKTSGKASVQVISEDGLTVKLDYRWGKNALETVTWKAYKKRQS